MTTFINDIEKMSDLLQAIAEDNISGFLNSYSYLTKEEVDNTIKEINAESLAELFRQAEKYYIEELNNRDTGLSITSEQAKTSVTNYVYSMLSKEEQKDFEDYCYNVAC